MRLVRWGRCSLIQDGRGPRGRTPGATQAARQGPSRSTGARKRPGWGCPVRDVEGAGPAGLRALLASGPRCPAGPGLEAAASGTQRSPSGDLSLLGRPRDQQPTHGWEAAEAETGRKGALAPAGLAVLHAARSPAQPGIPACPAASSRVLRDAGPGQPRPLPGQAPLGLV